MKAFKIKKRSQRQPIFIVGGVAFFKPHFPYRFFKEVHPPIFKKPQFGYEVVVQTTEQAVQFAAAEMPDSADPGWAAVRDYIVAQEAISPDPEVDS